MYKVLASCGAGIGTSMMIKRNIQEVFDELGQEVEITHESIGTAKNKADEFDIVFTLLALKDNFSSAKDQSKIVGLKNILSKDEVREAVIKVLEL